MIKKPFKEKESDIMIESCYIHIPFCNQICSYCDFCKMYANDELINKYLNALSNEIDTYYTNDNLKTIYIGGGTPSSLEKEELDYLFDILNNLKKDQECEFTFECNLNDIDEFLLSYLKDKGVNRISIGVESFDKKVLKILGREYNFNIKDRIDLAKKYFSNINIDLIYGIKGQTINDLKKDLQKFIELNVPHISIYSLILEDNTILKINNYEEIDEDLNREMYDYICKFLKENNYNHYEISNFSKEGYESIHNLNYWNNGKYYGFGLGASGYIDDIRYTNTRSITKYINSKYRYIMETITKKIDMENFMILGLRKTNGVSNKEFYKRYNKNIKDVFNTNKLNKKRDYYYIDESNLYISNYILKDFIDI